LLISEEAAVLLGKKEYIVLREPVLSRTRIPETEEIFPL
jgi:hypothetical protein